MTIAQTTTTSFKVELLQAVHDFGPSTPDTFKIALYTGAASINATTAAYTTEGETTGTGYTAGGVDLTISQSPTSANNGASVPTSFISFSPVSWTGASFTARGALIYNASKGNKSVAVLDFGADKMATTAYPFTITFPNADSNSAIVRIS